MLRKKLGEIFVDLRIISSDQLQECLEAQKVS